MYGKVQKSGLTEVILFIFISALWGFFLPSPPHHPSSSGITMGNDWRLQDNSHCSSWAPFELRNSCLGAGITDGCGILVYWYGRKCSIFSAVRTVFLPLGSRGTNDCWHSLAHGHTCPSSKQAVEGWFLLTLIPLTSSSSSFFYF